jgi:EAL and modified HD-GYP domain-containing signal transduction protein
MLDVFVARQPIFDRSRRTFAYELLFRDGRTDTYVAPDPDQASLRVLDAAFFLIGPEQITGGKPAFVNFTRDTLVKGYAAIVPSPSIVIELLETVEPDPEVLEACASLRRAGHLVALDDVVQGAVPPALLEVVDIVKVDFLLNGPRERRELAQEYRPRGLRLLAEKVETEEDWRQALDAGYDYFQGYFFSRPVIMARKDVPPLRTNLLKLLHEINRPDVEVAHVEAIIKREVSLTLKLLTYMNLAGFGFRQKVTSVRQALLLLGTHGLRKWASVVALADAGTDKPFELVVTSVVRAKLCERLASRALRDDLADDGFFLGLFSMLDVLFGRPLQEVLDTVPVAEHVRNALLGEDGPLRRLFEVAVAYERGEWAEVSRLASALALDEREFPELYLRAIEWGNSTARMQG